MSASTRHSPPMVSGEAVNAILKNMVPINSYVPLANGPAESYTCGYCGVWVASTQGWATAPSIVPRHVVMLCPSCDRASYRGGNGQITPSPKPGREVRGLDGSVKVIYEEARACMQANAHTSAVLAMRVLVMHVASEMDTAKTTKFKNFKVCVDFLRDHAYVPGPIADCVEFVRDEGNEGNHDLRLFAPDESNTLLTFCGLLLINCYEAKYLLDQAKALRQDEPSDAVPSTMEAQ